MAKTAADWLKDSDSESGTPFNTPLTTVPSRTGKKASALDEDDEEANVDLSSAVNLGRSSRTQTAHQSQVEIGGEAPIRREEPAGVASPSFLPTATMSEAEQKRLQRQKEADERKRQREEMMAKMKNTLGDAAVSEIVSKPTTPPPKKAETKPPIKEDNKPMTALERAKAALDSFATSTEDSMSEPSQTPLRNNNALPSTLPPPGPGGRPSMNPDALQQMAASRGNFHAAVNPDGGIIPMMYAPEDGIMVMNQETQTVTTTETQTDPDPHSLGCPACYAQYYGHPAHVLHPAFAAGPQSMMMHQQQLQHPMAFQFGGGAPRPFYAQNAGHTAAGCGGGGGGFGAEYATQYPQGGDFRRSSQQHRASVMADSWGGSSQGGVPFPSAAAAAASSSAPPPNGASASYIAQINGIQRQIEEVLRKHNLPPIPF